ncbi:DNA excision repair protein ERCC-1 isoform X3 [Petromyzon marinus]|uniref:DNA excision repair protein ERCC-1 isoform X3 n=1 Tax=Petromyzon marinus TaxID=7757 RepID=UPI003F703A64
MDGGDLANIPACAVEVSDMDAKKKFDIPRVEDVYERRVSEPRPLFRSGLTKTAEKDSVEEMPPPGPHKGSYADYVMEQSKKQPPAPSDPASSNPAGPSEPGPQAGGADKATPAEASRPFGRDAETDSTGFPDQETSMPARAADSPLVEVVRSREASGKREASGTSRAAGGVDAMAVVAPKAAGKSNSLLVNPRQRGNPVLKFVRNVPWEIADVVPDYVMGQTSCALFLSLRYHNLNPNYVHERLKQLGQAFDLRVLLVQVDVKDPHHALKELAKMCILAECTLILAWSPEEVARYLETYKAYENKPADLLKERVEQDYLSRMTDCLTTIKSVNKTDVITLLNTFGSLANIMEASKEDLSLCPGLGPRKARSLSSVFHEPFLKAKKPKKGS